MKKGALANFVLAGILASVPASAEENRRVRIYGVGNLACSDWSAGANTSDPSSQLKRQNMLSWASVFASAQSTLRSLTGQRPPHETESACQDIVAMIGYLEDYCDTAPAIAFHRAVIVFLGHTR